MKWTTCNSDISFGFKSNVYFLYFIFFFFFFEFKLNCISKKKKIIIIVIQVWKYKDITMQILWTIHESSKSSYFEQIKSLKKKNARWNEMIATQLKLIPFSS